MALKRKITKAEFDALNDTIKFEYKAEGDGYTLDVTGLEDTETLKRAKDHEVSAHATTKAALAEAREKLETLGGDVRNVEASFKTKLAETERALKGDLKKKDGVISDLLINSEAGRLASEITNAPSLLLPVIKARMTVDHTGDTPVIRILGADGKADEKLTVADIKKEILANKEYAPILVASKASGGGAPNSALPGGRAPINLNNPDGSPKPLASLDPTAMAAKITADKAAKAQT